MQGEKALAAELMVAWTLKAGDSLSKGQLPQPVEMMGSLLVFGFLAGMALGGEHWAHLAGALGSVILLTIAMTPPDITKLPNTTDNVPLLLRFFKWLQAWTGQPAGKAYSSAGAGISSAGASLQGEGNPSGYAGSGASGAAPAPTTGGVKLPF